MTGTPARPRPHSQLWTFHRILIGFAMFLGLAIAAWGWNDGATSSKYLGFIGVGMSVGLGAYLRWFNAKVRKASGQVDQ